MKAAFKTYLESVGITSSAIVSATEAALSIAGEIFPEDFPAIFVNDYVDSDGNRRHTEIELLSSTNLLALYNWNSPADKIIQVVGLSEIRSIQYAVKDFAPGAVSAASRLTVQLTFANSQGWLYKATSDNCTHLLGLVRRYIIPHLVFGNRRSADGGVGPS